MSLINNFKYVTKFLIIKLTILVAGKYYSNWLFYININSLIIKPLSHA